MSVILNVLIRNSVKRSNLLSGSIERCSTLANSLFEYDKDPSSQFLNSNTQKLLKSITRIDLSKIYRKRAVPRATVEYKFMTTEQIEDEVKSAIRRAYSLLQMPPIVPIRQDEHKKLSNDLALKAFDESKYIFTDITYGLSDTERTIVVRDTDGTLENANSEIRKRMNSIYFPMVGRRFRTPHMFESDNLKRCMDQQFYEFILDRACIQFEPNERDFHRITSAVYIHINETKQFDNLRSTRHFGPMAFFLAWHKMIDDLLIDMIDRDYLQNGVELICLYNRLNNISTCENVLTKLEQMDNNNNTSISSTPKNNSIKEDIDRPLGKTSEQLKCDNICLEFIQTYVQTNAIKKSAIEGSLQNYRLLHEERIRLSEGLHKAHGLTF